eukprot:Sspe_Gene.15791::Locus_5503_Transcript_1_1_Confidence_1.000_Length_432::g.15791::m.15791
MDKQQGDADDNTRGKGPVESVVYVKRQKDELFGVVYKGTEIVEVDGEGPASRAGLAPGVRFVTINGVRVSTTREVKAAFASVGTSFTATVLSPAPQEDHNTFQVREVYATEPCNEIEEECKQ